MSRLDYAAILDGLAHRTVPVLGAEAAAAHTRRGYGYLCAEELGEVWDAIDRWDDAGRPEPKRPLTHYARTEGTYPLLVSALTRYQLACEREMGLR